MLQSMFRMTALNVVHDRVVDDNQSQLEIEMGRASLRYANNFSNNTFLDMSPIPVIRKDTIMEGVFLGKGGFNEVREVSLKTSPTGEEEVLAMKHLLDSVVRIRSEFYAGAVDLISEAKILNAIHHKNIVTLHGVSCPDKEIYNVYRNGGKYSLFLDRLYGTVEEKLNKYRTTLSDRKKKQELDHRIKTIALPVAEALEYLHDHKIIFRDLKPSNIGFSAEGTVKLFDFGLAREVKPFSNRKLTGATGSRRYMAPEVALSLSYGLPADVYSYGIFLYETCTLQKPFHGMSRSEHLMQVVHGSIRPTFPPSTGESPRLQKLITRCWTRAASTRPKFNEIVEELHDEVKVIEDSQDHRYKISNCFPVPGSNVDSSRGLYRQETSAAA